MTSNSSSHLVTPKFNTMPKLVPVPIETNDKGFFKSLWIWFKSTREWTFAEDWDFYLPSTKITYVIPQGFQFDGASVPKRFRAYLSPVGLLLVPGIIHDFGYRYNFIWVRKPDGRTEVRYKDVGRKHWDKLFFQVGNYVNGVFIINALAAVALFFAGSFVWNKNRKKNPPDLPPPANKILKPAAPLECVP